MSNIMFELTDANCKTGLTPVFYGAKLASVTDTASENRLKSETNEISKHGKWSLLMDHKS